MDMYQPLNSNEFKQRVAEYFDQRTEYDEEGTFQPRIAHRLVEYASLSGDQTVLGVSTGTGLAAIAAARQLEQARDHYVAELKTLVSDRGIWNDITTFFCFGQKPEARS